MAAQYTKNTDKSQNLKFREGGSGEEAGSLRLRALHLRSTSFEAIYQQKSSFISHRAHRASAGIVKVKPETATLVPKRLDESYEGVRILIFPDSQDLMHQ